MKTNLALPQNVCSRPALAASTLSTPVSASNQHRLPSLIFDSLGPQARSPRAIRITQRDQSIIDLIFRLRALRDDQVQTALFTVAGASLTQFRLTNLARLRYVDRLPRKRVNDPFVYLLTRRSTLGNRMMRQRYGDEAFRRHMGRLGSIEHHLAVNDVRVRVERACRDLGWLLASWLRPEDLAPLLSKDLIPDGYFQIRRWVGTEEKTAGFFLELERSAKSIRVMRSKLERYRELYRSGRYQQIFSTPALRVLVVYTQPPDYASPHRISSALEQARHLRVTFAWFTSMDHLKAVPMATLLNEPIWLAPNEQTPVALFPTTQTEIDADSLPSRS